jgi:hypothetical protein
MPNKKYQILNMLKTLTTILSVLLMMAYSACSVLPEKNTSSTPENSEFAHLQRIDPIPQTLDFLKQEKYANASDHLEYFLDLDFINNDFDANQLFQKIQSKRKEWKYIAKKTAYGCLEGQSDEYSGLTAATICDLLVIGDIRDIGEQGKKYLDGEDIDKMTIALASLGVGAAGATAVSWGTSASLKPPISLLKVANKTGKTPEWLRNYLETLTSKSKGNYSTKEFSVFLTELWKLNQAAGTNATLDLLSRSRNIEDFQKLTQIGNQFGKKTSTLLKLGGDELISLIQRNRGIPERLYIEASTFGKDGIRALDKNGSEKFQAFLNSEIINRRRMTDFELGLIASGKKTTVLGNEFVKKNNLFNPTFLDATGKSNTDRMKMGLAPIGNDGNPINLHHMKQQKNGVLVEMSASEHRNHSNILHRYSRVSEIDREEFNLLKNAYWKMRAKDFN